MKKYLFILAISAFVAATSCNSKQDEKETKTIEKAQDKSADSSVSNGLDQLNQELNDSAAKDTTAKRV